jgi:glycosyltransferase involved in cell wall biosynthesis
MHSIGTKPREAGAPVSQPAVPAVTVVAPCFNSGRFLPGLMASLERQTFRDFEIVIVDDGSDDEATECELAAIDGRARVIRQDNRGPSAARNTGIAHARADIVAILDCDDTIEPAYLAETVPLLQAAPPDVAMVFTHMRTAGGQATVGRRYFNRFDLLFTNTVSVGLVLRKQCWRAVGGYDESMREGYEDWDFTLRLAEAGYRGIEVPKPLYIYYIRPDEMWQSRSSEVNRKHLHAKLWRQIRSKHPQSYRLPAVFRLWWTSRDGVIPLWKGLAACVLTHVMPDAWFSELVNLLRTRSHSGRTAAQIRSAIW